MKMKMNCIDIELAEICKEFCPRWDECPLYYKCKTIVEIGERLEDLCNDNPDFGVE